MNDNKEISITLPDGKKLTGVLDKVMPELDSVSQTQRVFLKIKQPVSLPENLVAQAVLVKSKIALDYIEKNKAFVESVMESNTGVSRIMICKLAQNEKITSKYDEAQEIAQSIEDKLGINVEIK